MTTIQSYQQPTEQGYYENSGSLLPEMLYPNVEELRRRYLEIMHESSFKKSSIIC